MLTHVTCHLCARRRPIWSFGATPPYYYSNHEAELRFKSGQETLESTAISCPYLYPLASENSALAIEMERDRLVYSVDVKAIMLHLHKSKARQKNKETSLFAKSPERKAPAVLPQVISQWTFLLELRRLDFLTSN